MYNVYVIQSQKNGFLYVGMTSNLKIRLKYHNQGRVFSTQAYRPWKLVYNEDGFDSVSARKREKYFKSGCGKEFLKSLIIKP